MGTDFAIILNDKIIYSSSEAHYSKFEIAIFSSILIKQLAENRPWSLHKLIMRPMGQDDPLKLLTIRHVSTDNQTELIVCFLGELKSGSAYAYSLLDKFYAHISHEYPIDKIAKLVQDDQEGFKVLCDLFKATMFGDAYAEMINAQSEHEPYSGSNKLLYAGISTNGLPIISKLYKNQSIFNIENPEKEQLIISILSGQLATISINAFIRAQCFMESIQIHISQTDNMYIFFDFAVFGHGKSYTLELLSAGILPEIRERNGKLTKLITAESIFNEPFAGLLKKFSPMQLFFETLDTYW